MLSASRSFMPHTASLPATFDPALTAGAHNAIHVCLKLQRDERLTLITDQASAEIAAALVAEIEKTGASYNVLVLEEYGARPHRDMPAAVLEDLAQSQVSIYACITQTGELRTRMQMMDVINPRHIRHGHMVNINKQIMVEGMRADFLAVDALSQKLIEKCRRTKRVTCKTAAGTDYVAELSPKLNWVKTSGLITPAKWGNLPGGEIFTTPGEVNGRLVVDGVVGDFLCARFGMLTDTPLTLEIEKNRLVAASSTNKELETAFWQYTHTDENSDRVGEFAIGTNIELTRLIGNILQDEKFPGIHIAFGNPYGAHTGADWYSSTHIDVLGTEYDIWVDDTPIMQRGAFLVSA